MYMQKEGMHRILKESIRRMPNSEMGSQSRQLIWDWNEKQERIRVGIALGVKWAWR